MKTRTLALILGTLSILCFTTGCAKDKAESTTSQSSETEYKTIEPPEDGWTIEELLSVTYICGHQLSYPLTLEVLGDEFSIEEDKIVERKNNLDLMLDYNGSQIGYIEYSSINKYSEMDSKSPINNISIGGVATDYRNSIVVNGFCCGGSVEEVINIFGQPDETNEMGIYIYNVKPDGVQLEFIVKNDGEVVAIKYNDIELNK